MRIKMERQIKYTKSLIIILAILACFSQALRGMAPPTLPGNFNQLPLEIQQEIISKLSDSDLARLAQTSRQARQVLWDELEKRQLKAATELSLWESRIKIDFTNEASNYPTLDQFKQAVLVRLNDTAQQCPEQWISLYLSSNNLGSLSSKNLKEFLQSITKYNVVELFLFGNQLTSLPKNSFNGLNKLKSLYLAFNQLSHLPEGIFNGLHNLQTLDLSSNQLISLPEKIFNNLPNLRKLYLFDNQLTSLPEKIFNQLPNLLDLNLYHNRLTSLPEKIFNNLPNLLDLDLSYNQLTSLSENIFNNLHNLRELNLSYNQLRDTEKQSIRRKLTNIKIIF
ncbi:hypothetical protein E3J79_01320 [Candidatus Dependentiae bacterium]|nr:MAG: hypothetical protein E3J79_01320 [Candidatus Dependentiae bacterium]